MKRIGIYIVTLSAVLLTVSSCKVRQKTVIPPFQQPDVTAESVIGNAIDAQPEFKTMTISKMAILINYKDYSFAFKGSLRIKTDSVVSLSIQPALGIEMLRVEFQPEGFAVYDKMNRRYSQNSYNYIYLKTGINVTYKAIEALFSHKIFTPQSVDRTDLCSAFAIRQTEDTTTFTLESNQTTANIRQRFDISQLYRITLTGIEREDIPLIFISYGKLKRTDGIEFPESVTVISEMPNLPVNASLQVDKISFNQPILISPVNVSRYTKAALTEIISFKK